MIIMSHHHLDFHIMMCVVWPAEVSVDKSQMGSLSLVSTWALVTWPLVTLVTNGHTNYYSTRPIPCLESATGSPSPHPPVCGSVWVLLSICTKFIENIHNIIWIKGIENIYNPELKIILCVLIFQFLWDEPTPL